MVWLAVHCALLAAVLATVVAQAAPGCKEDTIVNLYFRELLHELPQPKCTNCGPLDEPFVPPAIRPLPSSIRPARFVRVLPK